MKNASSTGRRRLWVPLMLAMVLANINGIIIVTVFLTFLIPMPEVDASGDVTRFNMIVFFSGAVVMVPLSIIATHRSLKPVLDWSRSHDPATAVIRRQVLHAPARSLLVPGAIWFGGLLVFALINLRYSQTLSLTVAVAVGLGALGTGVISYFTVQRILRPVAARALREAGYDKPELPGIAFRVLMAWALGTGVPVLGTVLVGIGLLLGILPASAKHMAATSVFLGGVALISGLVAMAITTGSVAAPMRELRAAMDAVKRGRHEVRVSVYDGSELGLLQSGFNNMVAGLEERERMRDLFGRHAGTEVAEHLLEHGDVLGGEELEVAVLFCDMVGSTRFAARSKPAEVVELLNRFYAIIIEVVAEHGGTVNKFLGDAGLCIFGAPLPHDDPSGAALRTARGILAALNERMPDVQAGIGVSAGTVVAGNVGSSERFEYTVIGDAVNEAARLTDLAKHDPGHVLAAQTAVMSAGDERHNWVPVGRQRLRGRGRPTLILRPRASVTGAVTPPRR